VDVQIVECGELKGREKLLAEDGGAEFLDNYK
jgi:hypothetical protein